MSVQSDVEMLSVQAVESYAKKHQISEEKTMNLFYRHHIFEKILLQHEYLHQLDLSETLDYVEEVIESAAPELLIFHGSNIPLLMKNG